MYAVIDLQDPETDPDGDRPRKKIHPTGLPVWELDRGPEPQPCEAGHLGVAVDDLEDRVDPAAPASLLLRPLGEAVHPSLHRLLALTHTLPLAALSLGFARRPAILHDRGDPARSSPPIPCLAGFS
jgi:hypothetical protein